MWRYISNLARRKKTLLAQPIEEQRLVLTQASLIGLRSAMEPKTRKNEEAIAYLLGKSTASETLIVSVVRPVANTTPGSFSVTAAAMATVVRCAVNAGLQVAGQAHTHPGKAYHSQGDDEGARIAYDGYVSLVFPNYGKDLPSLTGAAAYMYETNQGFVPIEVSRITVVPGQIQ